jgi:predicted PurR-regulated permease PerM
MQDIRSKFFFVSFLILIFSIFVLVLYMLLPFWKPIVLALISAIVFYPIFKFIKKFLISDFLAALTTILIVAIAVILPLGIAFFIGSQEFLKLLTVLNQKIKSGELDLTISQWKQNFYIFLYQLQVKYPLLSEVLKGENIKTWLVNITKFLSSEITKTTRSVFFWIGGTIFGTFVYLLTLFFGLYQGETAIKKLKKVIPLEDQDKEEIFETIKNSTMGVIYGTAGTAVIQSLIAFGLYLYYGLSYPFLWALLTALFAFIPPFGSGYIWFPITVYVLFAVSFTKGLVGLLVGFLIISSMDNIVRPLIMKDKIELPYIFLFFSILGGLVAFGFAGLFIGPTIFALFLTLIKIYEEKISNIKNQ